MIDITKWTDVEVSLLLAVKAAPKGMHDLDGVRIGVLRQILVTCGLWSEHWAKSLSGYGKCDVYGEAPSAATSNRVAEIAAEARIMARQGSEFGTTDAY